MMGNLEGQENVKIYMVLTKFLGRLREISYKTYGYARLIQTYEEKTKNPFSPEIKEKIINLSELSEGNISILYNLSFIYMLSQMYPIKKFHKTVKRLLTLRVNRIIDKVL